MCVMGLRINGYRVELMYWKRNELKGAIAELTCEAVTQFFVFEVAEKNERNSK